MRVMEERDPRFVNIERKVGVFILISILGLVMVLGLIGIKRDMFTPKLNIYFITDTGTDLAEGQLVKLRGFKIGRVTKVIMNDQAKVEVSLAINKRYMKWIRMDSKARLTKEGIIGDSVIEILPGTMTRRQASEGEEIGFQRDKSLSELAAEISDQIKPVLTDIKQIVDYINDPNGEVKTVIVNVNKLLLDVKTNVLVLLDDLNKRTERITKSVEGLKSTLVTDLDRITDNVDDITNSVTDNVDDITKTVTVDVSNKVQSVLDNVDGTVTDVDKTIKMIKKELEEILIQVDITLENVKKTSATIKTATDPTPGIVEETRDIIEHASEIVDSVQDIWILKPKPVKPGEKVIKMDSYE